jgi:hypothetical protein
MARFRRAFYKLTPSWLHTGEGERVLYSFGLLLDASMSRLRQGLLARFPTRSHVALDALGRDRGIRRGYRESNESYAQRLIGWRTAHKRKGNPLELLRQVRGYLSYFGGVKCRLVDQSGNWYTINEDGSEEFEVLAGGWNWDSKPREGNWGRFWVIIYAPPGWTEHPTLGDPNLWTVGQIGWVPDPELYPDWEGHSIGVDGMPPVIANELSQVIRDWKSLDSVCEWVVVAFDPNSFTPGSSETDGLWGNWSRNVAGVQTPTRLATARYWRLR